MGFDVASVKKVISRPREEEVKTDPLFLASKNSLGIARQLRKKRRDAQKCFSSPSQYISHRQSCAWTQVRSNLLSLPPIFALSFYEDFFVCLWIIKCLNWTSVLQELLRGPCLDLVNPQHWLKLYSRWAMTNKNNFGEYFNTASFPTTSLGGLRNYVTICNWYLTTEGVILKWFSTMITSWWLFWFMRPACLFVLKTLIIFGRPFVSRSLSLSQEIFLYEVNVLTYWQLLFIEALGHELLFNFIGGLILGNQTRDDVYFILFQVFISGLPENSREPFKLQFASSNFH